MQKREKYFIVGQHKVKNYKNNYRCNYCWRVCHYDSGFLALNCFLSTREFKVLEFLTLLLSELWW